MKALGFIISFLLSVTCNAQVDLITNGNFSAISSWSTSGNFQYTTFHSLLTNYNSPFGYSYLANFSGYPADNISGTLSQNFFVPPGTPGVTVSFWYRITTAETLALAFDTCRVSLVNTSTGSSILIARLTNLDANLAYGRITSLPLTISTGVTWQIRFEAGNDLSQPSVFRIDDVSVVTLPSYSSLCVTWAGGITPAPIVDTAMEKLCMWGVIGSSQTASTLTSPISRLEIARYLAKALVGTADISFLDNFPNLYPSLLSLSITDQRYVKLMLFLEYPLWAAAGTDNIAPFSRDYFYPNFSGPVLKSDAVKAMLETWNLGPSMMYYDPTLSTMSPMVCDMAVSNKNLGWVQRGIPLGLFTGITPSCGPTSIFFNESYITYGDFYVMLSRLVPLYSPPFGYDAFFVPNLFYLNNLNGGNSLEKGVFHEYSDNGFSIPSGGIGLEFQHSYHSNLTEIPFLNNDTVAENLYLKPKLEPLGGGWTHSYSAHIKTINLLSTTPSRILIYWPDGTVHSYLVATSTYETKGVLDKCTIDSFNIYGQPSKVTIKRGRVIFTFRNIDPVSYNVLSLVSVKDGYGNTLSLDYIDGYTTTTGFAPKVLNKVTDNYSGRFLTFSYWPGTNYLRNVVDPIGRTLTFYVDKYRHDLDSASDAMSKRTKYKYFEFVGSYAYRTHLLTDIQKPNGNYISNKYYTRKLQKTQAANYVIDVAAVPYYHTPQPQQNYTVTTTQNGQSIATKYTFDPNGNGKDVSTMNQKISRIFDTATNRILLERNLNMGYITRYSYDVNGYLSKRVFVDSTFSDSTVTEYTNNIYGEVTNVKDYNDPGTFVTETKLYKTFGGKDSIVVTNEGMGGEIRHQLINTTAGLLTSYISPTGYQTQYNYNSYGNVTKVYKNPFGGGAPIVEKFDYDAVSRTTKHVDYIGDSSSYAYDNNDNLTDVIVDPGGLNLSTHYNYDLNDNPTSIISPRGHTTILSYDFNTDDLIEENDGTDKKKWRYNTDGTLDTFISKNNTLFKHLYYNSSITIDTTLYGLLYSDGYKFHQYWGLTGNLFHINNAGKSNRFWYGLPECRSKWNKPDHVSTDGFFTGPGDHLFYVYDRMQRPSIIGYPAFGSLSYTIRYDYDPTTKKIETVKNASTSLTYVTYYYKKDGSPTATVYGNGDSILYHYDAFGRLDSIWGKNSSGVLLYSVGASLDNNGSHMRENTRIYYGGVLDTTLPALVVGDSSAYSYALRNRILTGEGHTFTSDNAGNITASTSPPVSYTWSIYDQLTSVNRSGIITNYEYDPLGIRRRKDNTYYVVDQENSGNVIMEATASCVPINVYIWGNGLVSRVDPVTDSVFYYHYDFRGSVIAITNQSGNMVKFYKYEPFGKVYKSSGFITWQNPYQFIGKEGVQADDSDLYYMKARYYQPSTGRFITEDPVWNTNLFTYCDDDPINRVDFDGKKWISLAQRGTGILGLIGSPLEMLKTTIGTNRKIYPSGWGGNQFVKTANLGRTLGKISFVGGTLTDAGGLYNYYYRPTSENKVSPTEFSINSGVGLASLRFAGPIGFAISFIHYTLPIYTDLFYKGGWEGYKNDVRSVFKK